MKLIKLISIKEFSYRKSKKKLLCFFNMFILFINFLSLSFKSKISINNYSEIFKNSDIFNIDLYKQSFYKVSNYLIEKYNCDSVKNMNKKLKGKKVIKIKSVGGYNKDKNEKWLRDRLSDDFIVNFVESDPDYLIFNVYNNEDLNPIYTDKNPVRIAIFTENAMVDINYADYIIGPNHIKYLDRFFNFASFFIRIFKDIEQKRKDSIKYTKKFFCAAVISNCGAKFRMNFINELNRYKQVDMGGKCNNNVNHTVQNKIKFLSNYKFSIAMENSKGDGYMSEKIVDSFMAGTIPIYYGGYMIDEFINPKTYILINGEKDIKDKIEYIKKIDQNDDLYKSIMNENPIIDKNFQNILYKKEIKSFLKNIFLQDKSKSYRRDNNYYEYLCNNRVN